MVPTKVPYYLLLIGDPERIPFSLQYQLDVEYGVGRLCFDSVQQYGGYVKSLIEYETNATVPNGKTAVFFGTRHNFDGATQLSADLLVKPLADGTSAIGAVPAQPGVAQKWGFATQPLLEKDATKARLTAVLRGRETAKPPAFLFTATHGMGWPKGDPRQLSKQGALLCQDWPGFGKIDEGCYFAASDIPDDAKVHGMINFHFACYGAGTPQRDNFIHKPNQPPLEIANRPFVAMLPQQFLAHPGGGALAVVGHVERAWGYSIFAPEAGPQILPFENAIGRILIGQPVGYAMKDFGERYAALATNLSSLLEEIGFGAQIPDDELAATWIERNDAQNYIILGDPAVHLRIEAMA